MGHTFQQGLSIAEIQQEAAGLKPITVGDIVPGAAIERYLGADAEEPEQLVLCAV